MTDKKYIIIIEPHTKLEDKVNEMMKDGREPIGGPYITLNEYLGQAMIRLR